MSKSINWGPALTLIIYQSLLIIGLPFYLYYNSVSWSMVAISVLLLYLTGLSITAGYHRLYSHRAYRVPPIVECIILFFASMAAQGSALRWAFDHRFHHAHVDTDNDPYSIKKGFWYAHFLWILDKPRAIDPKIVPDLMKNRLVVFQDRYIDVCMVLSNAIAFAFVGWLLNDYLGAFVLALWTRLFTLHHFTWFINSLAHTWGDKPFSQEQSAVDNYVLSLLTFGEGYHNYHHTFANDYRNGIRWYHFDPTKWLIWSLNKLGLAWDLKRANAYAIRKKMVIEQRNFLLEQITSYWQAKRTDLEKQVNDLSEALVAKLSHITQLKERYRDFKTSDYGKDTLKAIRTEIKLLKKSLKADWKQWSTLSNVILKKRTPRFA